MRSLKQYLCVPVFFVSVMVMVFNAEAIKFYINPSTTTTGNNGSSGNPWHRVDSVNSHTFVSGDTILMARGTMDTARPSDSFMPAPMKTNGKSAKQLYGFVCPKGSGTAGKPPILIDAYVSTSNNSTTLSSARPIISAKGHDRTAAIFLYDQDYWTIQNIEVRNYPASYKTKGDTLNNFCDPIGSKRSQYLSWRWGILVYDDDALVHHHIILRDNTVDSVLAGDCSTFSPIEGTPWWYQQAYNIALSPPLGLYPVDMLIGAWVTGGITIRADKGQYDNINDGPNSLDSVIIDSNIVHDIFGDAILVLNDSVSFNQLNTHLRIIGDTILRSAEDGILFCESDSAIISGNIIDSAGYGALDSAIYASDGYTIKSGSRRSKEACGMWFYDQCNTVVQYNAISNIVETSSGGDGEAIDFDQNGGNSGFKRGKVYIQYNYSCNNGHGFLTSCMVAADSNNQMDTSAIVRYNISQNDGIGTYNLKYSPFPCVFIFSRGGTLCYNNVFYNDTGIGLLYASPFPFKEPANIFMNNIFLSNCKATNNYMHGNCNNNILGWNTNGCGQNFFSNNCYYDLADTSETPQTTNDFALINANPNLSNPGKAATGFKIGTNEIASAQSCYKLNEPTPCFETGLQIQGSVQDFWGTNVSSFPYPDVGAYQTPTVETQVIPLLTVAPNDGWNFISFNIIPHNDSATEVFGTDKGDTNFQVLYSTSTVTYEYWPHEKINSFPNGKLLVGEGYSIYTDRPDTLKVQGMPVDYAYTPIELLGGVDAGFIPIAYLPQTDDSIAHALASLANNPATDLIVEDMFDNVYVPSLPSNGYDGVDEIGVMHVGQGYYVSVMDTVIFVYPTPDKGVAKRVAGNTKPMLHLPKPHHYGIHAPTGNNAPILVKQVTMGNKLVPDSSEIGAFDAYGNLVGSGTVLRGIAAFVVCGQNPMVKRKDGLAAGEAVSFKLWDGNKEYPLEFESQTRTGVVYKAGAVFRGQMNVSGGYEIVAFDLSRAYPNPFRGSVKISFDVPSIAGASQQAIEIKVLSICRSGQKKRGEDLRDTPFLHPQNRTARRTLLL